MTKSKVPKVLHHLLCVRYNNRKQRVWVVAACKFNQSPMRLFWKGLKHIKFPNITLLNHILGMCTHSWKREMPQVLLKIKDTLDRWGMVELQGKVDCPPSVTLQGAHIGDLHMDKSGTPQLVIGHHILTGKVVKLEKPLGVMTKTADKEWVIRSVVREKYIFKTRPKPIIQKSGSWCQAETHVRW